MIKKSRNKTKHTEIEITAVDLQEEDVVVEGVVEEVQPAEQTPVEMEGEPQAENVDNVAPVADVEEQEALLDQIKQMEEKLIPLKEELDEQLAESNEIADEVKDLSEQVKEESGKKRKKKPRKKWGKGKWITAGVLLALLLAVVIFATIVLSSMFKPRGAKSGEDFEYLNMQEMKEYYAVTDAELAKTVDDYEWNVGNFDQNVPSNRSDNALSYEIFKRAYLQLLNEEYVQSFTDGMTNVIGMKSTTQGVRKRVKNKIFYNIIGYASIAKNDERHYFDMDTGVVITNKTQISKGFRVWEEQEYVANYMYQPALMNHAIRPEGIKESWIVKIDQAWIDRCNSYIDGCKSSGFKIDGKGNPDKAFAEYLPNGMENYDRYKNGNYYEVLMRVDPSVSAVGIRNQVETTSKAEDVVYTNDVYCSFVIDENFRIQGTRVAENYKLVHPYNISFINGQASTIIYEFFYYGDDIKGKDENGNAAFMLDIEKEGWGKGNTHVFDYKYFLGRFGPITLFVIVLIPVVVNMVLSNFPRKKGDKNKE